MKKLSPAIENQSVQSVYASYPVEAQETLFQVRDLIYEVALSDSKIGPLTETLKWGEPSYLPEKSKSVTTTRLAWKPHTPEQVQVLFNCKTTLVTDTKSMFGDLFLYQGNRALLLPLGASLPKSALQKVLHAALVYHLKV